MQREQAAGQQRHRRRAVGAGRDAGAGAGQEQHRLDRPLLRVEDQAGAAAAEPDPGGQGDRMTKPAATAASTAVPPADSICGRPAPRPGPRPRPRRGSRGRWPGAPSGGPPGRCSGASVRVGRLAPGSTGPPPAATSRQAAPSELVGTRPAALDTRHAETAGLHLGAAGHAAVPGPFLAPIAARAQGGRRGVTIRDAETEASSAHRPSPVPCRRCGRWPGAHHADPVARHKRLRHQRQPPVHQYRADPAGRRRRRTGRGAGA